MDCIKKYNDLLIEIDNQEYIVDGLEREKRYLEKMIFESGPKDITAINYDHGPTGSMDYTPFDVLLSRYEKVCTRLEIEKSVLKQKLEIRNKILKNIKRLKGLEYKVAYKKIVEGKDLSRIADELGYSIGYIKNISSKINKTFNEAV